MNTKRETVIRISNNIGSALLRSRIRNKDFTLLSNDCYGAEIYKWLKTEYKTPFVGLMLMAPCYIKFLSKPEYYCSLPVTFIDKSKYEKMDIARAKNRLYPIALLEDIEIHFLHYTSEKEATEKWQRRIQRIDWNKIFVKFAMDKDYANESLLKQFEQLPYKNKVCFSKEKYDWAPSNIYLPNYADNAVLAFRNSLLHFNIIGWLNEGRREFKNEFEKLTGRILYKTLR
jgi:uncharacterized protein (DUF1919 family)